MDTKEIASLFGIGNINSVKEISTGHINSTHIVTTDDRKYILQSINTSIFKNPDILMKNAEKIEKAFENASNAKTDIPHYIGVNQRNFIETDSKIWRMYEYITESEVISNQNFLIGYAFGEFVNILNDKKIKLEPVIEGYHNFNSYFNNFNTAMSNNPLKKIDHSVVSRLKNLENTILNVFTVDYPKRNIHGDAKISNIIISDKLTVIDLDTAMHGYVAIDYGDMVRSVCRQNVIDMTVVGDITKGFAEGLNGILSSDEVHSLYYGILWVTGELAVRYFTDYLSEEKYFSKKTSAECLSRANELLSQLNMFMNNDNAITEMIYKIFA